MKRTIFALFCMMFAAQALQVRAQVVPSATGRRISVTAGGLGSAFQPDYAGEGIAETSPNRLYGVGAYVDVRINRWVQIEAEGRWSRYNQYLGNGEDTYLIGPRIPIHRFGRATPYAKVLFGMNSASFLTGHSTALAYGGGLDYRLTKRFSVRAFDFEYQQWQVTPTLRPYGASVGVGYRVF
jgi:opacity protein-like surface antigen